MSERDDGRAPTRPSSGENPNSGSQQVAAPRGAPAAAPPRGRQSGWIQTHIGICHESGCSQCDSQQGHIAEAIASEPQLATLVAQASINHVGGPNRRNEELDRRNRELQRWAEDCERRLDDTRRALDDIRRDRDRYRERAHLAEESRGHRGGQTDPQSEDAVNTGGTIAGLRNELARATVARDNYRAHSNELISALLRERYNIRATSSVPDTEVRPHQFFVVDRTPEGRTPRFSVPVADEDVVMDDPSMPPGARGYSDRLYALDAQGTLQPWARDPYEALEFESDGTESGSTGIIEVNDDSRRIGTTIERVPARVDSNNRPEPRSAASTSKGKGRETRQDAGTHGKSTAAKATHTVSTPSSNRPPPEFRPDPASNTKSGEAKWGKGWAGATELKDGEGWGWGTTSPSGSKAGPSNDTTSAVGGGGDSATTNLTPADGTASTGPTQRTFSSTTVNHPPFNGIQWVSRKRIPPVFPPNSTAQEKKEILQREGRNLRRAPLKKGELPPTFVELNTTTEEVLQNLFDRTLSPDNPGARDAIEILGELNNAAARARKPRHPLEDFVVKRYTGKPDWAKATVSDNPTAVSTENSEQSATSVTNPVNETQTSENEHETNSVPTTSGLEASTAASETEDVLMEPTHDTVTAVNPIDTPQNSINIPVDQNIPFPSPDRPLTPDDAGELLFDGWDLTSEEVRNLREVFLSDSSPLNDPSPGTWDEVVQRFPQLEVFRVPVNHSSEFNSQMLRGLLTLLSKLPARSPPAIVYFVLRTLLDHWRLHPGFIRANTMAVETRLNPDNVTNADSVIAFFSQAGIVPEEHLDVCALIAYIARTQK